MRRILARIFGRFGRRNRGGIDMRAAQRGVDAHRSKYGAYEALGQDFSGPGRF